MTTIQQPSSFASRLDSIDQAQVRELDRNHGRHSWSAQDAISPTAIARGLGSNCWDYDGNRYLDSHHRGAH